MLRPYNYIHAYNSKTGLLRTSGSAAEGRRKDIRCGVSQAGRPKIPRFDPGDKSSGRKIFKQLQEAYDVLSDSKKRQMYDQYGFTATTFHRAGRGEEGGTAGSRTSTLILADLILAAAPARPAAGSSFRDLFSQFFSGGRGSAGMEPEHEPGGDLEYQLRSISGCRARRGEKALDHAIGHLRDVPRNGPRLARTNLHRVRRNGHESSRPRAR